jgi:hypothetical protein
VPVGEEAVVLVVVVELAVGAWALPLETTPSLSFFWCMGLLSLE